MNHYERPVIVASYTVHDLVAEAAVCMAYGGGHNGGSPSRPGGTSVGPAALPDTGASGLTSSISVAGLAAGISLIAAGQQIIRKQREGASD